MTYYRETFRAGEHEFPILVRTDHPDPAARMWAKARGVHRHNYPTAPQPQRLLKPHERVGSIPRPPTSIDWTNQQ